MATQSLPSDPSRKMPFASKAQQRKLLATNPKVAKEFASKTPNFKALPEKVGQRKSSVLAGKK